MIKQAAFFLVLSLAVIGCKSRQPEVVQAPTPPETPATQSPSDKLKAQADAQQEKALAQISDSLVISIERSPCFGRCPWYKLQVFKGGFTVYEGKRDVKHVGKFTDKTSQADIQKIIAEAERVGYFDMQNKYDDPNVTDLPSTVTVIRSGKQLKMVTSRFNIPKELSSFEKFIEAVFSDRDWSNAIPQE